MHQGKGNAPGVTNSCVGGVKRALPQCYTNLWSRWCSSLIKQFLVRVISDIM